MKALLLAVLLALVAIVAYDYFSGGELRWPPWQRNAQELELEKLERQLAAAKQRFEEAVRTARESGTRVTEQVETARRDVARIEKRLTTTLEELEGGTRSRVNRWSKTAHERVRTLQRAVEAFKRELEQGGAAAERKDSAAHTGPSPR